MGGLGLKLIFFRAVLVGILKRVVMGDVGTLAVLDADWSVTTKSGGFFGLINNNELSHSVPATFGRPLSCRTGTDQLLTSDINPSRVSIYLSRERERERERERRETGMAINYMH